jgi:hypothetical protein
MSSSYGHYNSYDSYFPDLFHEVDASWNAPAKPSKHSPLPPSFFFFLGRRWTTMTTTQRNTFMFGPQQCPTLASDHTTLTTPTPTAMADTEFLADYEDEPEVAVPSSTAAGASAAANGKGSEATEGGQKKDYAGIHSSGFRYVPASCFHRC